MGAKKRRPKKTYKVWVEVEEFDEETERGEIIGPLDMGCTATYRTYKGAKRLAKKLHDHARGAPGWTA